MAAYYVACLLLLCQVPSGLVVRSLTSIQKVLGSNPSSSAKIIHDASLLFAVNSMKPTWLLSAQLNPHPVITSVKELLIGNIFYISFPEVWKLQDLLSYPPTWSCKIWCLHATICMQSFLYLIIFFLYSLSPYSGACHAYCKKLTHDKKACVWHLYVLNQMVKFYNHFCMVNFNQWKNISLIPYADYFSKVHAMSCTNMERSHVASFTQQEPSLGFTVKLKVGKSDS